MTEHTSTNEGPPRMARYVDQTTPENQAETFRNQDEVWPVRAIRCGETVRPLPQHACQLDDLSFEASDTRLSVADGMARHRTAGLLVLKRGEIALDRYGLGKTPQSRWTSFSTAKSMTATPVGPALHDGAIASLDDRPLRALPAAVRPARPTRASPSAMCFGCAPASPGARIPTPTAAPRCIAWAALRCAPSPAASSSWMWCKLPSAHPQGAVFNYNTGESCVLGALVAAAVGRPLADYFGERIWGPAGMEADAHWQLGPRAAWKIGGLGVSARLRDVGRLGQFVLEDGGRPARGQRVLPPGWRDLAGQPDCAATGFGRLEARRPRRLRLPVVGHAARARHPQRRLRGARRLRPGDLHQPARAGGRRHPQRLKAPARRRRGAGGHGRRCCAAVAPAGGPAQRRAEKPLAARFLRHSLMPR